ncbi:MAG: hypothetical protein GY772_22195, partial [bacterium]|nr:hypothetical protein [bacterium]
MAPLLHGVYAPGEEYEKFAGKRKLASASQAAAAAAAADGSTRRRLEAAPEDEIDEEEQMGAALVMESEGRQWRGKDWAQQFRERLGVPYWGHASVGRSVGLMTSCTSMRAVLLLQEVLPTGTLRVLAMLDTACKGEPFTMSSVNLARQNCKPERLFVDCTAAIAGRRHHCETKHESAEMAPASAEDSFVGAFWCTPCLSRHPTRPQMSCFDNPHAAPYREEWKHTNERKPAAVLLAVMDHEEVLLRYREGVFNFRTQ